MAVRLAFAADKLSIVVWDGRAIVLGIAFVAAFPVNYWLIRRGRCHAVVHQHHGYHGH